MDLWTYEREQWEDGKATVCGVDEAGAGPLAGPVYAAAVILPRELELPGLDDSKKLTEKKREELYKQITEKAEAWSIARVEAAEIDEMDILNARMLAMQLAIDGLKAKPDFALIDGNRDHGSRHAVKTPHSTIIKGDGKSASIAAASILAKVSNRAGTALYPRSWTSSTRNTVLQSTRATAQSTIMKCWTFTAPVRPTAKHF